MPDYIPSRDSEFNDWLNNFVNYAGSNLLALGLMPADMLPITIAKSTWDTAFPSNITAQQAAQAAKQAKDAARSGVEGQVRALVKRLQASTSVDNAERASLGITVPDTIGTPIGTPTTSPVGTVDHSKRLQHTIHFRDETTPASKAKPAGAIGAEIFVKTVASGQPVPTDPADFTFVALDTSTPYTLDFDAADGGKNAHYILRWVTRTGEKGPWSAVTSATVVV